MGSNSFGQLFTITTFGESHGPALGVVIDGIPPRLEVNITELQEQLSRRAPGRLEGTSSRIESDAVEILSGVFENKTLGTPIAVVVRNHGQRSSDYDSFKHDFRPGHADETYQKKFGIRDHRGGGRASARETVSRVIGGYFAGLVIPQLQVCAYVKKLGPFSFDGQFTQGALGLYGLPGTDYDDQIKAFLNNLKQKGESIGGVIGLVITGCPAGLGAPVFDKLKADFAKAFLSLPACVAYSYGLGEEMSQEWGSIVSNKRENFGGMEGGISNGGPLSMQLTFKPTTTLGQKAREGRHDPCVLPRALPIVEAMAKIVLADHWLRQKALM